MWVRGGWSNCSLASTCHKTAQALPATSRHTTAMHTRKQALIGLNKAQKAHKKPSQIVLCFLCPFVAI